MARLAHVLLVRHPEPAVPTGICYGRLDLDLSAVGLAAIDSLAAHLRASGITRIFASPARRCRRLAFALHPESALDARLHERDFGDWEGRRWDDIARTALDAWAADPHGFAPGGGESTQDLLRRIRHFAADLLATSADAIVITHGGPLRLLPALLRGETPDPAHPPPPFGAVLSVHPAPASPTSTAVSASTAHAPATSPVNPPI